MIETSARQPIPSTGAIFIPTFPLTLKAMTPQSIFGIDAWVVSALGEPAIAGRECATAVETAQHCILVDMLSPGAVDGGERNLHGFGISAGR